MPAWPIAFFAGVAGVAGSMGSMGPALASPTASTVRLVAPTSPPHEGDAMPFNVHESAEGPIYIDGCAALELELKSGDKWLTTPWKICDMPVPAVQLDGDLAFSIPAPASGTYRAVMTWGTGCAAGFPLTTALCAQMGSVTSDPLVVAPRVK